MGQIWWLTSVIPAIRKLKREESHEFQASLNYNETLSQTNKQTIIARHIMDLSELVF